MTDCKTYDPRLWRLQWNHIKHHAGLSFGPDESNLKAQSMLRLGVARADSCTIPCNGDSHTSPSTTNTDLRLIQSLFAVKVNIELPDSRMLHAMFSEAPSAICISTNAENMLLPWFPTASGSEIQEHGSDIKQSVILGPLPYDIFANSAEVCLFEELKCESPVTNLSKAKAELSYHKELVKSYKSSMITHDSCDLP